ncbi:hypothetical protein ABT354_33105 [Streptomyces sp. NPDC000594]|uniref:DUF6414 family protein n=1 Tax=Streptomyces sp. NPDC000594 TaxID=3154261 RepID=UPI00331E401A
MFLFRLIQEWKLILREFLYVDTEKVRAMLAQLDGGVPEEARETTSSQKSNTVGPRSLAQHLQLSGSETYTQKSLGDAIFPALEGALESEGLLRDISEEATILSEWTSGNLRKIAPPGSLVRVTANGSLFDTRYSASVFAAFSSVAIGLQDIGADMGPVQNATPGRGRTGQQKARPAKHGPGEGDRQLEDAISDFVGPGGVDGKSLRAITRIARGVFAPGLNINLSPVASGEVLIGSRLQEGRQYLDSEPDILFARYGAERQEWTVVGSVGSYGPENTDMPDLNFLHPNGAVNRGAFADGINALMKHLGGLGFVDLPQYPGFSLIPFAVYRTIPRNASLLALRDQ